MQHQAISFAPWECVDVPESYDQWIATFTDRSDYPWAWYGKDYDALLAWKSRQQKSDHITE